MLDEFIEKFKEEATPEELQFFEECNFERWYLETLIKKRPDFTAKDFIQALRDTMALMKRAEMECEVLGA